MRTRFIAALAGLTLAATALVTPSVAAASTGRPGHCARDFHAAVVEDNEAYNAHDAADDHHVAERVRGRGDVADGGGIRLRRRQQHLQHADDVAPVGHRGQHPRPGALRAEPDPLRPDDLVVRRAGERDGLGAVLPPRERPGSSLSW